MLVAVAFQSLILHIFSGQPGDFSHAKRNNTSAKGHRLTWTLGLFDSSVESTVSDGARAEEILLRNRSHVGRTC